MAPCLSVLHTIQRETFEGENFCEFRSFVTIRESLLHEIWGRGILWCAARVSNPRKFSPQKSYFFTNLRKFSPLKVSRYTVDLCCIFCVVSVQQLVTVCVVSVTIQQLVTACNSLACVVSVTVQQLQS